MHILARIIVGAFFLCVLLLALVAGSTPETSGTAYADPLSNGEICLVAQNLIDLDWNYTNYPQLR